ncbi:hypothetical protein BJY52DRAFT_1232546 [Lactarius psammicola]|nr:hypothetical protein BJY52DRAFT_1232546 [Lactarius psammicola]
MDQTSGGCTTPTARYGRRCRLIRSISIRVRGPRPRGNVTIRDGNKARAAALLEDVAGSWGWGLPRVEGASVGLKVSLKLELQRDEWIALLHEPPHGVNMRWSNSGSNRRVMVVVRQALGQAVPVNEISSKDGSRHTNLAGSEVEPAFVVVSHARCSGVLAMDSWLEASERAPGELDRTMILTRRIAPVRATTEVSGVLLKVYNYGGKFGGYHAGNTHVVGETRVCRVAVDAPMVTAGWYLNRRPRRNSTSSTEDS